MLPRFPHLLSNDAKRQESHPGQAARQTKPPRELGGHPVGRVGCPPPILGATGTLSSAQSLPHAATLGTWSSWLHCCCWLCLLLRWGGRRRRLLLLGRRLAGYAGRCGAEGSASASRAGLAVMRPRS